MLIHGIKFQQSFLLIEVAFARIAFLFVLRASDMPKANGVKDQKSYLFTVLRLNKISISVFLFTLMGKLMLWHSPS